MSVQKWLLASATLFAACANASNGQPIVDSGTGVDSNRVDGGVTMDECADGTLAVDVSSTGQVTCAPIADIASVAIVESCSVYLGWRDGCNNCTSEPTKWGHVSSGACDNGAGESYSCIEPTLGDGPVRMFGLNFDGNVDGNDKIYTALHCTAEDSVSFAPCDPGHFVVGKLGSSWSCASFATVVVEYINTNCSLYTGWQDDCNNCTSAPVKWGRTSPPECRNGAGADNTCTMPTLGNEEVRLFGLNPDGDVDGNDKLHIGLTCTDAEPSSSTEASCPPGHFVTATYPDGMVRCDSAVALAAKTFKDNCALYFGWQDNCDACFTPPPKWGRIGVGTCMRGAGADNTCTTFTLGGRSVSMFGLNPDGNVDGNDMLYVGMRCM